METCLKKTKIHFDGLFTCLVSQMILKIIIRRPYSRDSKNEEKIIIFLKENPHLLNDLIKNAAFIFNITLYGHFYYSYHNKLSVCHHFVNLSTFLNGCWHQTVWATEKLQTFLESWNQSDCTMFYSPRSFDHDMFWFGVGFITGFDSIAT